MLFVCTRNILISLKPSSSPSGDDNVDGEFVVNRGTQHNSRSPKAALVTGDQGGNHSVDSMQLTEVGAF